MKFGFLPVGARIIGISSALFKVVNFFKETWEDRFGFEPSGFGFGSSIFEPKLPIPDFI